MFHYIKDAFTNTAYLPPTRNCALSFFLNLLQYTGPLTRPIYIASFSFRNIFLVRRVVIIIGIMHVALRDRLIFLFHAILYPPVFGRPACLQIYGIFMIGTMPRTRSQSAADRAEIVDPPSNITVIDVARRVVRWARAIHFVATTVEDTDPGRTGFIDEIQQSGSRSVIVARKLRAFHDERWNEAKEKNRNIDYGAEDDDDEEDEEEVEHEVEAAFDEDYSLEKAVAVTTTYEVKIVGLLGERREAMLNLHDSQGAAFLATLIEPYHESIAKWNRVESALQVCAEQGGEACVDMTLRRNWWK